MIIINTYQAIVNIAINAARIIAGPNGKYKPVSVFSFSPQISSLQVNKPKITSTTVLDQ